MTSFNTMMQKTTTLKLLKKARPLRTQTRIRKLLKSNNLRKKNQLRTKPKKSSKR